MFNHIVIYSSSVYFNNYIITCLVVSASRGIQTKSSTVRKSNRLKFIADDNSRDNEPISGTVSALPSKRSSIHCLSRCKLVLYLTHWGWDKKSDTLYTTFSNTFSLNEDLRILFPIALKSTPKGLIESESFSVKVKVTLGIKFIIYAGIRAKSS